VRKNRTLDAADGCAGTSVTSVIFFSFKRSKPSLAPAIGVRLLEPSVRMRLIYSHTSEKSTDITPRRPVNSWSAQPSIVRRRFSAFRRHRLFVCRSTARLSGYLLLRYPALVTETTASTSVELSACRPSSPDHSLLDLQTAVA